VADHFIPEPGELFQLGDFFLEDRRFPAVYILYNRGDVVYVGQTRTLRFRIDQHLTEGVKVFDGVAFIRCTIDRLLEIEGHYIRRWSPKYNACGIAKKVREKKSWLQADARYRAKRSRFAVSQEDLESGNLKFIRAEDCTFEPADLAEMMGVSERDADGWRADGDTMPTNVLELLNYTLQHRDKVSKALVRFENL
jgi:hypothetical protein